MARNHMKPEDPKLIAGAAHEAKHRCRCLQPCGAELTCSTSGTEEGWGRKVRRREEQDSAQHPQKGQSRLYVSQVPKNLNSI